MTDKRIKNEKWYVKDIISRIRNQEITKPKFQRKKKWDIIPKSDKNPNEQSYIEFLFKKKNSVHAITFGQETIDNFITFSNIDGNNRINAIQHFIENPFQIFNKYLDNLFKILDTIDTENIVDIKNIFVSLSYNDFLGIKRPDKFFKSINRLDLFDDIQNIQNQLDDEIENIQTKLKINGEDNFDSTVEISVNIFEGYNTDELCETFEEINKFNSRLTETELLACKLFNVKDFIINDNVFKTELENSIQEYYQYKSDNEALKCYLFDFEKDQINAYDFITSFQNLCCEKYSFILKTQNDTPGFSLFLKLWKSLYGSYINTFTTENVNKFIDNINYSCEILNKTISTIFTDKINDSLFNKSCKEKIKSLRKNTLYLIFGCIIGYKKKNTNDTLIIKKLEKCILYHFMVNDLKKNKEIIEYYKKSDEIKYSSVGGYVDNQVKSLLSKPELIDKLNKDNFIELLNQLINENNKPYPRKLENGKYKNITRRPLKFFEKTLMFYYYKGKIPTNMLNNSFSIEHIIPNSSEWNGELDKDRTGNLIPILASMNNIRNTRHINTYNETEEGKQFSAFIKDIIPFNDYDNIILYENKKPIIKNNDLYNQMCSDNEEKYKECFIKSLFEDVV
jgi:hypothetical protein